jgi:hypothetical protein
MGVDEATLEAVRAHMRSVKVPDHFDKVYKDECMFCFATAESPGGLYVNLSTHQACDQQHLELDMQRSGPALYLHQMARRVGCRCTFFSKQAMASGLLVVARMATVPGIEAAAGDSRAVCAEAMPCWLPASPTLS